jgi:hypothetical protein
MRKSMDPSSTAGKPVSVAAAAAAAAVSTTAPSSATKVSAATTLNTHTKAPTTTPAAAAVVAQTVASVSVADSLHHRSPAQDKVVSERNRERDREKEQMLSYPARVQAALTSPAATSASAGAGATAGTTAGGVGGDPRMSMESIEGISSIGSQHSHSRAGSETERVSARTTGSRHSTREFEHGSMSATAATVATASVGGGSSNRDHYSSHSLALSSPPPAAAPAALERMPSSAKFVQSQSQQHASLVLPPPPLPLPSTSNATAPPAPMHSTAHTNTHSSRRAAHHTNEAPSEQYESLKQAIKPVTAGDLELSMQMLKYDLHREMQDIIKEQIRQFSISKVN